MIKSTLRVVVAHENARRAEQALPPLTQQALADATGISLSVINGLMTGRTQRLDFSTLDRLCTFFRIQPGDLLRWDDLTT
jgi:DNA-binding Xre family transcriptional regulator